MAVFMVSVATRESGAKGAILVEIPDGEIPDLRAFKVDPEGEDVADMGLHTYYDKKQMEELQYLTTKSGGK